jgi:hypothetical protein
LVISDKLKACCGCATQVIAGLVRPPCHIEHQVGLNACYFCHIIKKIARLLAVQAPITCPLKVVKLQTKIGFMIHEEFPVARYDASPVAGVCHRGSGRWLSNVARWR